MRSAQPIQPERQSSSGSIFFASRIPRVRSGKSLAKETHEPRNGFHARKRLCTEFAALCQCGDAVGGAESQRFDGNCGLATAGSNKAAAIAKEKILDVVRAVVGIDDRSFR